MPKSCRRASPIPPTAVGIYQIDMADRRGGLCRALSDAGRTLGCDVFRTPTNGATASPPFRSRPEAASWQPRYYQHNAIERALEAIASGKTRILLTLATGTGKTAIAFQIAWTLFQTPLEPERGSRARRPRILFLADRNILADQAYNAFSAFPSKTRWRASSPDEIRKKGRVPKNASVFFTIFQTFMSGTGADGEACAVFRRLSAGLLRLHHHRRMPSRRRQRREQLARHPRLFLAGGAARPDRDAEARATTSTPTPISASRFTPIR